MEKSTILTSEGLTAALNSPRARINKEFICRSTVVFFHGQICGHIFLPDEFQAFLKKCVSSESRREAAFDMFTKFARPWGSSGHRVFPSELVDGLLDMLAKV